MNKQFKAIIIDDEVRARTLLQDMLNAYCPDIEVIASCDDLPNGVKSIRKLKPDLIFLDIEMPGHSGLELFDFFNEDEIDFSVIFTTAYNQYAINAIKLAAIDYLLKPITPTELEEAIERFKKKKHKMETTEVKFISENRMTKIAVPTTNGIKFLETQHIVFLKAEGNYTEILMEDSTKLLICRTLKNCEETLQDNPIFFRSHKSYLINLQFLTEYIKSDGGYLILKNKYTVPISPEKVNEFLEKSNLVKR